MLHFRRGTERQAKTGAKKGCASAARAAAADAPLWSIKVVTAADKQFAHPEAVVEMGLETCLEPCPLRTVLDCLRLVLERATSTAARREQQGKPQALVSVGEQRGVGGKVDRFRGWARCGGECCGSGGPPAGRGPSSIGTVA